VFTLCSAFFVVRTKANVLLQRRYSHPVDKTTGVRSDHTVILTSFESASVYPDAFRRVTYLDVETKKRFKFLTNNFTLPAHVIAQIYKSRWAVELFFKWIKQHLRIKAFYRSNPKVRVADKQEVIRFLSRSVMRLPVNEKRAQTP
jgi:IS4 transposase